MTSSGNGNDVVLGDAELQTQVLESNASAENYHRWLCDLALPFLGEDPLELGSGLGDYAQAWLDSGLNRITITEIEPSRSRMLKERFAGDDRVRFAAIDLDRTAEGSYSAVVSFNVLEHVPDHVGALVAARCALAPGGAVVTFAPAFPGAMSQFDRSIGHVRRYTLRSMRETYESAGLEVEECRYVNAPGLLAWWLGMRVLRMTPQDGPILRVWDRAVVPAARRWESRYRVPFGQSVFCVGRKPA